MSNGVEAAEAQINRRRLRHLGGRAESYGIGRTSGAALFDGAGGFCASPPHSHADIRWLKSSLS